MQSFKHGTQSAGGGCGAFRTQCGSYSRALGLRGRGGGGQGPCGRTPVDPGPRSRLAGRRRQRHRRQLWSGHPYSTLSQCAAADATAGATQRLCDRWPAHPSPGLGDLFLQPVAEWLADHTTGPSDGQTERGQPPSQDPRLARPCPDGSRSTCRRGTASAGISGGGDPPDRCQ